MSTLYFHADDLSQTGLLASALAEVIPDGTTVSLEGTLGAGKTQLVRFIVEALGGASDDVVSPTFVLQATYATRKAVQHFDAYRLPTSDEFLALGSDELLDGTSISFVEWGERVADVFPEDYWRIAIEVTGESSRQFAITVTAAEHVAHLRTLQSLLPGSEFRS